MFQKESFKSIREVVKFLRKRLHELPIEEATGDTIAKEQVHVDTHLGDTPDKVNITGGLQDNAEYREARKSSDKIEGNSIDSKELKMQTGEFSFVKLQYYNKQVEEGTVINEKSLQDGVSLDGMFARTLYDEKIVDGISFHSNALQSSFGMLDLLYIINKLEIKNFFLDMLSGEPTVKQVTRSSKMIFLFVR